MQDHGEKLYRRSLYTYWKRTVPPPNMAAFDAPNRETCVVSRPTTNTPLQALVLLNDVQFVEAARNLATRALQHSPDRGRRLEWMALSVLSRRPSDREQQIFKKLLDREQARYQQDLPAAAQLIGQGESEVDRSLPPAELAAWTQAASLLLNLSETITRN